MYDFKYNPKSTLSEDEQLRRYRKKLIIRQEVETFYDSQHVRIQTGNRLVANFRNRIGVTPDDKEEDPSGVDVLRTLKLRFEKITEGLAVTDLSRRRKFKYDGIITDYGELYLVGDWIRLMKREQDLQRNLQYRVEEHDIWHEFLKDVKGAGPAMGAVIIAYYDMHKAPYVSSLWSYTGLDVASDGRGRSRRQEHLVDKTYVNTDGEVKETKGLSYNPFVKTKIRGVLATCLLRSGSDFRDDYDRYKHRIENSKKHATWILQKSSKGSAFPDWTNDEDELGEKDGTHGKMTRFVKGEHAAMYERGKSAAHRHEMALRYMTKAFLRELYIAWRPLEGLPVRDGYAEAKLGHEPHKQKH